MTSTEDEKGQIDYVQNKRVPKGKSFVQRGFKMVDL